MNSYDKTTEEKLKIFKPMFIFRKNKMKISKTNNLEIKFHQKLISYNNESDIQDLTNKIKNFLLVMNSKCNNFEPNIFYKNFNKTCFDLKKLNNELINGVDGSIIISKFFNILELKRLSASYHELLHLASLKNNKEIYTPFNEGYTQLLEERYFKTASKSYFLEVKAMHIVELIIGKDELEKLYFSGNFNYLNQLFIEANPNVKLDSFYKDLYYITKLKYNYNFNGKEVFFQKHLNKVFETLLCCFLNSFNKTIIEEIELIKDYFCFKVKFDNKNTFNSIEEERFYNIINEYKNKNFKTL